jgi:hypothetical protein
MVYNKRIMSNVSGRFQEVRSAIKEDFKDSSKLEKAIFAGSIATLAAHEFFMEATLASVGTEAYHVNPLLTGVAMGGLSLAAETGLTHGIAKSADTFKNASAKLTENVFSYVEDVKDGNKTGKVGEAVDTAALAFALGSPGVIMRDHARDPSRTYEENKKKGMKVAKALAAMNLGIGTVIGVDSWAAENMGAPNFADPMVNLAESKAVIAGIVGVIAIPRITKVIKKLRGDNAPSPQPEEA